MPDDTSNGGDEEPPAPFDADADAGSGRPVGDLLETVSDRRARYVLAHLESVSVDVVDLEDVAEYVAERERAAERGSESESGAGVGDATSGDAESGTDAGRHCHRVAVALHHNHLPKLDAAAVLDYDPRSRTVRYRGDDRVGAVLDLLEASEDR